MDKLKELKERSVEAINGVTVAMHSRYKIMSRIVMEEILKFNGCYAMNNSTVCFICEDRIFVTPYTRNVLRILQDAGFREEYFYVPFSNGDFPVNEEIKWAHLREMAKQSYILDYENDCEKWSDEHGIGRLSPDVMEKCFRMPTSGVPVKHLHFEDLYFPACNEGICDCTVVKKLGGYYCNNGRVVFVYRDGHTYVTRGYWIIDELEAAGYREISLFVPFSNGEEITDLTIASKWEKILSISKK